MKMLSMQPPRPSVETRTQACIRLVTSADLLNGLS